MAEPNLSSLVREMWMRGLARGLLLRMPLLAKMLDRRRITWRGGTKIKWTIDHGDMDDLAQSYKPNEGLTSGETTMTATASLEWKFTQVPIKYNIKQYVSNGPGSDTNPTGEDFVKWLTGKGMRAARLKMLAMMFAAGSSNRDGEDAADANWQSINDALTHDITYGGKTRADTTTNRWFQGASVDQTYTDQATSVPPSVETIREMMDAIAINSETMDQLLGIVGTTNFRRLKSQIEAQRLYRPGPLARYGFQSMYIDDMEVVAEPYLENAYYNANYATSKKYAYVLNVDDFEYRIHPDRAFEVTPFVHQAMFPNAKDEWLARVLLAGNLACKRPPGSILRTNVW